MKEETNKKKEKNLNRLQNLFYIILYYFILFYIWLNPTKNNNQLRKTKEMKKTLRYRL